MNIFIFIIAVFTFHSSVAALTKCPSEEVVFPCQCRESLGASIECSQTMKDFDLAAYMEKLNKAMIDKDISFSRFVLSETNVKNITENVFGNLTFDDIAIDNNRELKFIHPNAFQSSYETAKYFDIMDNPTLINPDDVFDVYKKFRKLRQATIMNMSFTKLPSHTFSSKNMMLADQLLFVNVNFSVIEEFAFDDIPNIMEIDFNPFTAKTAKKNAFNFPTKSEKLLNIYLRNVNVTESTFEFGALSNFNRPVALNFVGQNELDHRLKIFEAHEKIFRPYLEAAGRTIRLGYNSLVKCDCTAAWLFRERDKFEANFFDAKCQNNKTLWEQPPSEFENCPQSTMPSTEATTSSTTHTNSVTTDLSKETNGSLGSRKWVQSHITLFWVLFIVTLAAE